VLLALGFEVIHVDVAVLIALGDDHLQAHHLGTGRVGAVGAGRDQADVAVALALRAVVGLDDQQTGVFALAACVGLQADAFVAGGLAQPVTQLLVQQLVACQLVGRGKGVHARKLGPGDRDHLAGGVEFHGAAAQWDHAAVQRQVLVGQLADVAQHAGLGVVAVEDRVREEGAGAAQRLGDQRGDAFFEGFKRRQFLAAAEQGPQGRNVFACGGFVQADADKTRTSAGVAAQVDALGQCLGVQGVSRLRAGAVHGEGVKGGAMQQRCAELLQAFGQHSGVAGNALRDPLEAIRAMIDRVHAGHYRRQHLRGADVRCRFFAADVLFTRLQRQSVGGFAVHVHAHAHQTTGQ